MPNHHGLSFTTYGWATCSWILIVAFQYGYHISALNQIQAVLTCKGSTPTYHYSLPTCIPMSDAVFSFVTAIFTVGGLMGSLVANIVMDRWGRRGASSISTVFIGAGAGFMAISSTVTSLSFGRLLVGIGSGIGLCVGPIFLSEIAPSKISGNVGVLTQLSIVFGIMVTQSIGLKLATPTQWRLVLSLSCLLSTAHFFASTLIIESPVWLSNQARLEEKRKAMQRIWGTVAPIDSPREDVESGAASPLLRGADPEHDRGRTETISVPRLLKSPELMTPLMIVCLAMSSQQLSGINAVLYYSNDILSKSLPEFGPYVSLGITIVNVLMTFPPIILIERMGRRQLLGTSIIGSLVSLLAVGWGLNSGWVSLSSIAILTFVMSFAIGLGPIPFVMIPEVSPPHAVSALSSVALSLNWTINFFVGLVFLPLRNFISGGDDSKGGRVFYLFAFILFLSTFSLSRVYRG